ncbi:NAD(P)H-binding protein [uncultured Brevundimonas sp.]|uniref:NAD(P)H-binding protein n=1 Tax=uncultured Brevundimonas sp. TaxID=213418 RepID=UPI0030EDADBA
MATQPANVLVTGPTGKVGRRLIPLLWRRGVVVRAASRSPVTARAGVEPVRFDWADESTYESARTGVDAMYLVPGSSPGPEHAGHIRALLDGADKAGVKRVVLLSVYGVDQAPPDNPLRRIELAVESSGVPYTIVRPGAFMQNFSEKHFLRTVEGIRERDEIVGPGGDGVVSHVSTEDIAAVAAIALSEGGHEGKGYPLLGPEPLTMTQVAEQIAWVAGRPIRYVETDHTPMRDALLAAGEPLETAEHNSRLHAYAFSSGAFGGLNDDILEVTGRPPVSFAEYAAGAAAAWHR